MTTETSDHIMAAVPIGEGNAATPRQIARTSGIGAESSWGGKLRKAVKDGKIKRRQETRPVGFAWVYWREAP
jgi:hypothetical protein